jgi:hypothetical protein
MISEKSLYRELHLGEKIIQKKQRGEITPREMDAVILARTIFGDQIEEFGYNATDSTWKNRDASIYVQLLVDALEAYGRFQNNLYRRGRDFMTNLPYY